jgi:hypothetical protein
LFSKIPNPKPNFRNQTAKPLSSKHSIEIIGNKKNELPSALADGTANGRMKGFSQNKIENINHPICFS